MIPTVMAYDSSDNVVALRLLNNNFPANLKSVEKVDIVLDGGIVVSSDKYRADFTWGGDDKGVLKLVLGRLDIPSGVYTCKLIVFDDLNYTGIFWGFFRIRIV